MLKTIFVLYFSAQFRFFIDVFFVAFVVVVGSKVKEKIQKFAIFENREKKFLLKLQKFEKKNSNIH